MDFNDTVIEPDIEKLLQNPDFPIHFDELELDSLLYGENASQESSPSSSFAFSDQSAGFRSRDGGSLGDSSSDSSPPLSCANFTENDQEMWDFGFQNPGPFENLEQNHFHTSMQEEKVFEGYADDFSGALHYVEEEQIERAQKPAQNSRVISLDPKTQPTIRRVVSRTPIHKVYRIRDASVIQQLQQHQRQPSYRVVQPVNAPPRRLSSIPPRQPPMRQVFADMPTLDIPVQPQSGPLIRLESEEARYVPIAPTRDIKTEPQAFTSEQTRKIRNRIYAQASRIRKKEAEEHMKMTIQDLLAENEVLRAENAALKQQLGYYEPEPPIREYSRQAPRILKQKKMIAAGTVLMMFGLFAVISPFNVENHIRMNAPVLAIANESSIVARHGRVLGLDISPPAVIKPHYPEHDYSNSTQHECETFKLNATETLRVNKDIERWVQVHSFDNVPVKHSGGLLNKEAMRKFNEAQKKKMSAVFGPETPVVQKKAEQAALRFRERTWRQLDRLKTPENIPIVHEKVQRIGQDIDKIASIVRQKGDTLYIMTLQDYVLLPSLKKGANSIPKLSLLMPMVPMNGTLLDQYTLLRVDCEVTGTGQLTLSNKQLSYLMP